MDKIEILVHITAPSAARDDARYRSLAAACGNFEAARRIDVYSRNDIDDEKRLRSSGEEYGIARSRGVQLPSHDGTPQRNHGRISPDDFRITDTRISAIRQNLQLYQASPTPLVTHPGRSLSSGIPTIGSALQASASPSYNGQALAFPGALVPQSEPPSASKTQRPRTAPSLGFATPRPIVPHRRRTSESDSFETPPSVVPDSQPPLVAMSQREKTPGADEPRQSSQTITAAGPSSSPSRGPPPPKRQQAESSPPRSNNNNNSIISIGPASTSSPLHRSQHHPPSSSSPHRLTSHPPSSPPRIPSSPPAPLPTSTSHPNAFPDHSHGLPTWYFPPPPPTGHGLPTTHITWVLAMFARQIDLPHRYRPISQTRELHFMERGHWSFFVTICPEGDDGGDTPRRGNKWTPEFFERFWTYLGQIVREGKAGWGVRAFREVQPSPPSGETLGQGGAGAGERRREEIKIYCWGEVVGHVWLMLFVCSERRVKRMEGVVWKEGSGRVVVRMGNGLVGS